MYDASKSSPAPVSEGAKTGYFDDQATKDLLRLTIQDPLLNDGSYGVKEPGQYPIEVSWLREGSYDQRLLPFVPRGFRVLNPDFHSQRDQHLLCADALHGLRDWFNKSLFDSQWVGRQVTLSLPPYALQLVPKLLHRGNVRHDQAFPFQFQAFFSPSAARARWVRILHVASLLDGYANLCHRILMPQEAVEGRTSCRATPRCHSGQRN